jgi:hypothetical protein
MEKKKNTKTPVLTFIGIMLVLLAVTWHGERSTYRVRGGGGNRKLADVHTRPFSIFSRKESRRFVLGILVLNASPFVVFISAEETVDSFTP